MPEPKRAAHFLLHPELADSPPNDALVRAYLESGLGVDLYAPGGGRFPHAYGDEVRTHPVEYGFRWLARNGWRRQWRRYSVFSGTAEDPLAIVGALALWHRRPSVALVDEIKTGSYRGDARESWKRSCQRAVRQASVRIVNDPSRIPLLRDYAGLSSQAEVIVYPGGYVAPPPPVDREMQRRAWGVAPGAIVIGLSGGFNLTAGADWLIEAVQTDERLHAVIQPLGVDPLARFLLPRLRGADRIYVEPRRLSWREAWSQAAAFDAGVAVYLNPAPQFQNMGMSSNRLCMYLAMGVPVIASRQPSFEFLERWSCGKLVESPAGFLRAVREVTGCLADMSASAFRCWSEYVATRSRWQGLRSSIAGLTGASRGRR